MTTVIAGWRWAVFGNAAPVPAQAALSVAVALSFISWQALILGMLVRNVLGPVAFKLGVSKPVITRALDSMGRLELVSRRRDEKDRRNVLVQRTVKGALYLERLADTIGNLARKL